MKKVLFVATVLSHFKDFHLPYMKYLQDNGYEVHIATKKNIEKIQFCDVLYDLPFERFPLKMKNLKVYRDLKKIIEENQYDIIHCHTPVGGLLTRSAARKARKKGTKVFYTAHGFHFYKGAPKLNWIIYYPIEKMCAHFTDCLITITNEDYELAKKRFKAKRIEHINGIGMNPKRLEKELTYDEKINFKKSLGIAKEDIVFSYIAELNKNKNQILLLNVIKDLKKDYPNIKLLLISEGPLKTTYKEFITGNKLDDNVKLLGRREDINEILSITDIYLASSIREGLPVNIMEAMYKGIPIIATNNRGHRELINDNVNGFIINSEEEMKDKVLKLIDNKELQERFSKNSKEKSEKYCIANVMKEMEKIYQIKG